MEGMYRLPKIKCMNQEGPFSYALYSSDVRIAGNGWYWFLDGYSGNNKISIAPKDQEKTTFTCPYGTFMFKRMSFLLSNALATF